MRKVAWILLVFGSAGASAGEANPNPWFCTADGYQGHVLVSVSGEYRATEAEAQSSAVQVCRLFGYSACKLRSCFDLNTGEQ